MNNSFKTLIESINVQIKSLNENDLKIYDEENPEFFIRKIEYDGKNDKLIFRTEEDSQEV